MGAGLRSVLYAAIQLALALPEIMAWGLTPIILTGSIVFDYIIAYGILGIAGIFRKKGSVGICFGIALALVLRFISHFISGTIFFGESCPDGWNIILYSICYNGAYMLPEMILTMAAAVIIFKAPAFKRIITDGGFSK